MKRTPNPSYRIHRLHPRTTRSPKLADGRKSSSNLGGQNWTPITPSRGSILHAETQLAFAIIVPMLACIVGFIAIAKEYDRTSAGLFVPYAAWVTFATILKGSIAMLNS
jgi:hypothetical protein